MYKLSVSKTKYGQLYNRYERLTNAILCVYNFSTNESINQVSSHLLYTKICVGIENPFERTNLTEDIIWIEKFFE